MAEVTGRIAARTDLARGVRQTRLGCLFADGDRQAHRVEIHVTQDGAPLPLEGCAVRAYFIRADGLTVTAEGTARGSTAAVTLPAACYAAAGRFQLIVKAGQGDVDTSVFWGTGTVTASATDRLADPEERVLSLPELLAQQVRIRLLPVHLDGSQFIGIGRIPFIHGNEIDARPFSGHRNRLSLLEIGHDIHRGRLEIPHGLFPIGLVLPSSRPYQEHLRIGLHPLDADGEGIDGLIGLRGGIGCHITDAPGLCSHSCQYARQIAGLDITDGIPFDLGCRKTHLRAEELDIGIFLHDS